MLLTTVNLTSPWWPFTYHFSSIVHCLAKYACHGVPPSIWIRSSSCLSSRFISVASKYHLLWASGSGTWLSIRASFKTSWAFCGSAPNSCIWASSCKPEELGPSLTTFSAICPKSEPSCSWCWVNHAGESWVAFCFLVLMPSCTWSHLPCCTSLLKLGNSVVSMTTWTFPKPKRPWILSTTRNLV